MAKTTYTEKGNLESIANNLGYSISTVSRVLNGNASKYRISDTTAKKIIEEAKRINYMPSILAKGLRTNKTYTLGLIIPNIENSFFANIAGIIIREARLYNYKVVVSDTQENEQFEQEAVSSLLARHVDGIIIAPCGQSADTMHTINKHGIPVVQIDRYYNDISFSPYISTDNYKGGVIATEHLISCGHKKIACIQGFPYSIPVINRTKGYADTLIKYGLNENIQICGDKFSIQNGYLETKLLLSKTEIPTAIFAQSNLILLGTIKAIYESGLKIPDDISVISFDDNIMFNFLNPAISSIAQPTEEIGILSVKVLTDMIAGKHSDQSHLLLPPQLRIRNSVKNIK